MEPSIKCINVGERLEFSHIEHDKGVVIIHFKNTWKQVVILDEFAVAGLCVFGEMWLTDERSAYDWREVEIECYYHTPINTVCLSKAGSEEFDQGKPVWVRGLDPYSEFVKHVYKSARNKSLIVNR